MTGVDIDTHEPSDSAPPAAAEPTVDAGSTPAADDRTSTDYRLGRRSPRRAGRRTSKWDRPPPPHDWRWWVGGAGRTLIAVGLLMLAFVAYQLWGTGIENAAAQRALEDDFEELLAQFDPVEPATSGIDEPDTGAGTESAGDPIVGADGVDDAADATDGVSDIAGEDDRADAVVVPVEQEQPELDLDALVPVDDQRLPPVEDGDAIARIEIPRIGVNDIVVAGVEVGDLKRGPGHFPDTPLPGQIGNAAIAGHRTTYGAPFFEVDRLEAGDEIRVTTLNGLFVYRVTGQQIVSPSQYGVVATTDPTRSTLTLVSCHPRWTAQQRIVISAELDAAASGPVGAPVLNYGRPDTPAGDDDAPAGGDTGELPTEAGANDAAGATDEAPAQPGSGSVSGALAEPPATADELLTAPTGEEVGDVFGRGWFSDPSANVHVGLWGLLVAAIATLAFLLSRRARRDVVGLAVGIVPFVVALYFFFQNVNRLLPPNL